MTVRRRALISVYDKTGIIALATGLIAHDFEIISTGGTAKHLREAGVEVRDVSEITAFPEILNGRVKTLHPYIHGAILADISRSDQKLILEEHGVVPIELVVVNLYPFEKTIAEPDCDLKRAIENIDIGGPTMIRAAAKNNAHVAVLVNPDRYEELLTEIKNEGAVSRELRLSFAADAFSYTAAYESAIAKYFQDQRESKEKIFPEKIIFSLIRKEVLRYGENPQQAAAFYRHSDRATGLAASRQLQGKQLSYNNLNDLNAALELLNEFDLPAAVAVKHAGPCGVGTGENIYKAYSLAYDADPVSIFGGVIALNREVNEDTAAEMLKTFLEVIAAPVFSDSAIVLLAQKKDIRLIQVDSGDRSTGRLEQKNISGGCLIQTVDYEPVDVRAGTLVTKREPTKQEWEDLCLAQKVVKHTRSNAIVIAAAGMTLGIGAGQTSRIGAARIALEQASQKAAGASLGSDAFFPFPDTVELAAKAGITAIVQPGGSQKDNESIELCNRHGLAMVFTDRRYFKH